MRRGAVLIGMVLWTISAFAAQQADRKHLCDRSSMGKTVQLTYGQLTLTATGPRNDADTCSFRVLSPMGDVLGHDEYVDYIPEPEFVDLDGDGSSELVVIAGSNGSGGYADSFVFSQAPQPRLIRAVNEACPFQVVKGPDGWTIVTCELDFGAFDGLCSACSPHPAVYLKVEKGLLHDRSSSFARHYDENIEESRKQLKDADVRAFLKSRSGVDPAYKNSKTRPIVLSIVIDYVYSGREPQAQETLQTMWPEWDRERVWADIINTRSVGVLERLH